MSRVKPALFCLLLTGCFSLDSFLFEPTRVTEYLNPADIDSSWQVGFIIPDSMMEEVELLSSGGNRIYGFFVRPEPDSQRLFENQVTVLYCHGKDENINRYWGRVELLWEMGYQVFIFDYQGYGKSEGSPSGDGCYEDTRAALEYCLGRADVADSLIVYYGWSLGSFMATYLAVDSVPPLGLTLEAPMASVSAIAREGALLDIPGSFVAAADFDNETRIARLERPVLIVYGDRDETSVAKRNSLVLIDRARRHGVEVEDVMVQGAHHDDIPDVMGTEYGRVIREFIAGCAGGR